MCKKGDIVNIRGFSGSWTVINGPDSDGEVSIQDKDSKGWFYVAEKDVSPVGVTNSFSKHPTPATHPVKTTSNSLKEETIMNNTADRKVAVVSLIDTDAGLKPELALVKKFGTVVFDGSTENMKMKLIMDNDVAGILAKHNGKRAKEVDLSIRKATGQELKLMPVELSDLKWVIDVQA